MDSQKKTAAGCRTPAGGFVLPSVVQLVMLWTAYREKHIRLIDVRLALALWEVQARRVAIGEGRRPNYRLDELQQLTHCSALPKVRAGLARLEQCGLVTFRQDDITFAISPENLSGVSLAAFWHMLRQIPNHRRRVPLPRRMLRYLARHGTQVLIATVLAHLFRCLYYQQGTCNTEGNCRAAWVAETFGISSRNVKAARGQLIALGWLIPLDMAQWHKNRYGQRAEINLAWSPKSAPPQPQIEPRLAPPVTDKETLLRRCKKQNPPSRGVCQQPALQTPTLRHVVMADLVQLDRLLTLFNEAVSRNLLPRTEYARLCFVAAAVHALRVGNQNPCGLFAWLIKHRQWDYLTAADDDLANARLKEHLHPKRPSVPPRRRSRPVVLSPDAQRVREIQRLLERRGLVIDPLPHLQARDPSWTSERWQSACDELDAVDTCVSRPVSFA